VGNEERPRNGIYPNPRVPLNNQRAHAEGLQARAEIKPTMSASYNQDDGFLVIERRGLLALLRPFAVVRRGIAQGTNLLWEALEIFEVRVHAVRFPRCTVGLRY
jgi:hypothetical protein